MHKILVIDSDKQFRKLLVEILSTKDFTVLLAENETTAKSFLQQPDIDLIIVDVGKKGNDLSKLICLMLVNPNGNKAKIITMSGDPKKLQLFQSKVSGIHIKGQESIEELTSLIHRVLDG